MAVTGPPPKNYDFNCRVIGGSRSPHGSAVVGIPVQGLQNVRGVNVY